MLKELLEAISEQAVTASTPAPIEIDLRKPYLIRDADGETTLRLPSKDPRRIHRPASIEAISMFAAHNSLGDKASAWFDRTGVTLFPVDIDREDALIFLLTTSPQLAEIIRWSKDGPGGMTFDQKAIKRLLMVRMKGCLMNADDVLQTLSQVRWIQNEQKDTNVLKGKSSLGKSLQTEFVGIDSLPDYLTFNVPVWENGFVRRQPIEVALEPDEQSQSFRLIPVTGAIETAFSEAETVLGESLRAVLEQSVPIYYGKP